MLGEYIKDIHTSWNLDLQAYEKIQRLSGRLVKNNAGIYTSKYILSQVGTYLHNFGKVYNQYIHIFM